MSERRAPSRKVLLLVLGLLALPPTALLAQWLVLRVQDATNGTVVTSGERRTYLLHVPETLDPDRPAPLVISLHGGALTATRQRDITGWNEVADREGFLVVYPSGRPVFGSGPRGWAAVEPGPVVEADVRFIADLLDQIEASHRIDPRRIYVDGLSNGGAFAFVLSCMLGDRIAAVGTVAAAHLLPDTWCDEQRQASARPVPGLAFHGTEDRLVPYLGGRSWVSPRPFPDARDWATSWARRNGCLETPQETDVADDVTRWIFPDCSRNATVELYTVHEGGHTWPGGGPHPTWLVGHTTHSISASELLWRFYLEHPLPAGTDGAPGP